MTESSEICLTQREVKTVNSYTLMLTALQSPLTQIGGRVIDRERTTNFIVQFYPKLIYLLALGDIYNSKCQQQEDKREPFFIHLSALNWLSSQA